MKVLKAMLLQMLIPQFLIPLKNLLLKEPLGLNVGLAASLGLIKGESFSGGLPTGATIVLTTPFGFKVGPFDYTVSVGIGSYLASSDNGDGTKLNLIPAF